MLKPVPKKDQPKVIALSVLVAGLAGTAFVQLNAGDDRLAEAQKVAAARAAEKAASSPASATASRITPVAPVAPVAPVGAVGTTAASGLRPTTPGLVAPVSATSTSGAVTGADATAARVVGDNGAVFDLGAVGPPVGGKDPFQTKAPTVASTVAPAPAPTPVPSPLPDTQPRNSSGAAGRLGRLLDSAGITSTVPNKISRGGVSIAEVMNGGGGASVPGGAPVPTYVPTAATAVVSLPPPPPPSVVVAGIIIGVSTPESPSNGSVAMLRSGDLAPGGAAGGVVERRFVRVGDSVGNGFVVAQIYSDNVIIKSGKRRFTLYLGVKPDWMNAAAPGAAAAYAPAYAPVGNPAAYTGKDAAQFTDKNTSNNNYAPAALVPSTPAAYRGGVNSAVSAAASPAGSQIGESFRAK